MLPEKEILNYFAQYIEKEIGMVFSEDQHFRLKNRLQAICSSFRFEDFEKLYWESKKGLSSEVKTALLDVATNNETSFFRDKKVFNLIYNEVIPELVERNPVVYLWSVASSSGQEAYSLSMLFEEWALKNKSSLSYHIDGTDISSEILRRATEAKYSQLEVQRGLSTKMLLKYFEKTEDGLRPWSLKPAFKKHSRFTQVNLVEPFRMNKTYDLVLCRNVLIYQKQEKKTKILERVGSFLRPGGYLIMGSGEMPHGLDHEFETILKEGAILFKKKKRVSLKNVA